MARAIFARLRNATQNNAYRKNSVGAYNNTSLLTSGSGTHFFLSSDADYQNIGKTFCEGTTDYITFPTSSVIRSSIHCKNKSHQKLGLRSSHFYSVGGASSRLRSNKI